MIVLAMAAADAAVALPFAPPLERTLRYRAVRTDPGSQGEARIETIETLRFARDGGRIVATHELEAVTVAAPPRVTGALEALFVPLLHIPVRVAIGASGIAGAPIDAERGWAAIRAASATLEARIAADGAVSPAVAAMARRGLADDLTPAARDARLTEGVALLLAPALPPLVPGVPRVFGSTIAAAGDTLPARGTITLDRADAAPLTVRIALISEPGAAAPAAARMRATIGPDMPPELRARIERAATELADGRFVEDCTYRIDPASGLVLSRRMERGLQPNVGPRRSLGGASSELLP